MSLEKYSNALHSSFVPQCECVSDFGRVGISLGASHLCAVSERGDTCGGDSGGGLVRAVGDRYELVGVVSFGVGCDSRINGEWQIIVKMRTYKHF